MFMGDLLGSEDEPLVMLSTQGGFWNSTAAINRVRVFGGSGSYTTRYDFSAGTQITLYGLY